jgi:hypothetical protein
MSRPLVHNLSGFWLAGEGGSGGGAGSGGTPADPSWPNIITGEDVVSVVDYTPTAAPGTTSENVDGVLNEHYADAEFGNQTSLVTDETMPGGRAVRVNFPAGMWGVPLNYPSAASYGRDSYFAVPVTIGQTHVVAYFVSSVSAARLAKSWELAIAPSAANGMQWHNFWNFEKYTDRVEFDLLTPAAATGDVLVAATSLPQEPVSISGSAYSWVENDKNLEIYFGQYIRASSGFTHNGNDGTKSVYAYSNGTLGGGWNPAILCYLQKGASSSPETKGYPAFTNQFAGSPNSFFNVGGNARAENINVFDGETHRVELWLKYESPYGSTNGEAKMWVDGTLVHHATGHRFWDAATTKAQFRSIKILPIFGGGPATVPADQQLFFGPIKVAVR